MAQSSTARSAPLCQVDEFTNAIEDHMNGTKIKKLLEPIKD
jgi:hypothetical protein